MTSITAPTAPTAADFAAAGVVLDAAEYAAIAAWRPFCSPEGCVCEKSADCDYCGACQGAHAADDAAYDAWLAVEVERDRVESLSLGALMYGEPTEDDRYDW